jgi:hypothetical protein
MSTPYYADEHVTLYHGDCREVDIWESAHCLVTDPPFGIAWFAHSYNRSGRGQSRDGIAGDADTAARDYVIGQWGQIKPAAVFGHSLLAPPFGTKHTLVWRKPNDAGLTGAIAGWRRDWEAIYLLGNWPPRNPPRSGVISTTSVGMWSYLNGHPHAKPVSLFEVICEGLPRGMIADPFAGSGSTLIAARNLGRKAIGVEIEERYCEIAARRLDQLCLDFGDAQ